MNAVEMNPLCDAVRQCSFDIHRYHRCGHLEKIYENALVHRLRKLGLQVQQQHRLPVYDEDGTLLGDCVADLYVDDRLIVEVKATAAVAEQHIAQILGYLRAARVETGLLINFGAPRLFVKRYLMDVAMPEASRDP